MDTIAIKPVVAQGLHDYQSSEKSVSARERVMASTVSVDEYFDELISLVRKDYADL